MQMAQIAPNLPEEIIAELVKAGEKGIPIATKVMLKKLGDMERGDEKAREKIRYGEIAKPLVDLALMLATILGTRKATATLKPGEVQQLQKDYERLQKDIADLDRLEQVVTNQLNASSKEEAIDVEAVPVVREGTEEGV